LISRIDFRQSIEQPLCEVRPTLGRLTTVEAIGGLKSETQLRLAQ
jgi:hypothetical protein